MTVHDPWAEEPTPKADTKPAAEGPKPSATAEAVDEVVVTLKAGTSFSDPWIVLHAKNVQAALNHLSDNNLKELMDRVKRAGKYFVGEKDLEPAKRVGLTTPEPAKTWQPPIAQAPPAGESRYCSHGEMVYKTSKKDAPKKWRAFMCPQPQGESDRCTPQWL